MKFIKSNWKGLLFPIICCCIIAFDYYFDNPFVLSLVRILIFSFFHFLYVYKTKYVYDSDVYRYLDALKTEYERKHIIKPFLSDTQSTTALVLLVLSVCVKDVHPLIYAVMLPCASLLIMDSINIFMRTLTNKAELNSIRSPASLTQVRFVFTWMTKITPNCKALGRFTAGALTMSEVVYPKFLCNDNTLGPVVKMVDNKILHPELKLPIETKLDHNYESYRSEFAKYRPNSIPLPDRTQILFTKNDILDLGVDKGHIESMISSSSSLTIKK
jgi:hypothetical protein